MEFSDAFLSDLQALFAWRRDVRRFHSDPIPGGVLDALIEDAATAPSVGLSEPWRFVKIESADARAAVIASFERCNAEALAEYDPERGESYARLKLEGLREAPLQLAVFCDETDSKGHGLGQRTMAETRRYSCVCAVMQLWLSARARGLGLGWVSILDPAEIRRAAQAPESWSLVAYLCIGFPEETHLDCELERAGWETRRRAADRVTSA